MWAESASLVARSWGCGAENDEEGLNMLAADKDSPYLITR